MASSAERRQEDNITALAIKTVREILPAAKIILSTWRGSDLSGLACDEVVLSEDPGADRYDVGGVTSVYSVNRMILSTMAGLNKVKTPYAMKLRSDNYLTHDGFLKLFEAYQQRCEELKILNQRVVSSSWFARDPRSFLPYPYHPSDMFFFGLTEDLINIWDEPFSKDAAQQYSAEQHLWLSFLKKNGFKVNCKNYCDATRENIPHSELSLVNNLLLAPPEMIGFCSPKHKSVFPVEVIGSVYSFTQWRVLYAKLCGGCPVDFFSQFSDKLLRGFSKIVGRQVRSLKAFAKQNMPWVRRVLRK